MRNNNRFHLRSLLAGFSGAQLRTPIDRKPAGAGPALSRTDLQRLVADMID